MYRENNVFPLNEAYEFAKKIGGVSSNHGQSYCKRGSIKDKFIDEKHGGTSQARRALM